MVPPPSNRVTCVRSYSGSCLILYRFRLRGSHPLRRTFPESFGYPTSLRDGGPYPGRLGLPVWALSRSLAATRKIDVSFSSWGYLDVSVHPVSFCTLWIHVQMRTHCSARVPPFGNLRVIGYLLLTAAYRSLSRPSSASGAKASALCSFLLDQSSCLI